MLTIVGICVILLILLLMLKIPLPYCFGGALLFMCIFAGVSMKSMMLWVFSQTISPVLLASPMFILAGSYMGGSGIATKLLDFVDSFIGRIKGGLGVVSVLTCAVIGAISGSGFTGVAATGPVIIPRMVEQGYPRGYSTALVTVSSVLGLLIPPSGILIIYGWVTETSILACFLSTVGPGLLITLLFCIINMIISRKFDLVLDEPRPFKEKIRIAGRRGAIALPALLMPVIILGGIYGGIFTPTEAAAVAAIYSIPIGFFVYRTMNLKDFYELTLDSVASIGAIMSMIIFCLMLSQTFVLLQVPQAIIDIFFSLTNSRILMLILINLFLFVVGMIVNDATGMILCAPILLPLVLKLGISPVQFAAIMGVNLAMGGVTPPYASILYLGMRIGKCEFNEIFGPTMILLVFGYIPVVFLTTFWPALSLWLPGLFGLL
ncbi:TRAP transporter large permease [Lutispora saccharofermentans]|uniref:TRAP transporter large permease n=1 Tax=Lutispora saccharofermentans TaxID=3024236 RepID=A0ABT1ND75_9FIRM|nr:TRAP transporter large permease [Lutispora saccharofermentans]MCQ1529207.1 TRAP transporter large permease [Lutispora saccharofermentans]